MRKIVSSRCCASSAQQRCDRESRDRAAIECLASEIRGEPAVERHHDRRGEDVSRRDPAASSSEQPRFPAIVGSATLTTVMSTIAMNMPSITVTVSSSCARVTITQVPVCSRRSVTSLANRSLPASVRRNLREPRGFRRDPVPLRVGPAQVARRTRCSRGPRFEASRRRPAKPGPCRTRRTCSSRLIERSGLMRPYFFQNLRHPLI